MAQPLNMMFIDGGHTVQAAVTDYEGWALWVAPGGVLAIRDVFPDSAEGGQASYRIYQRALKSSAFTDVPGGRLAPPTRVNRRRYRLTASINLRRSRRPRSPAWAVRSAASLKILAPPLKSASASAARTTAATVQLYRSRERHLVGEPPAGPVGALLVPQVLDAREHLQGPVAHSAGV